MDDEKCRIHLDTMKEIYMMAALNLKMAWDRSPSPTKDPSKINFKIGNMVLLRNHTFKHSFDSKYKPSFWICKKISDKTFEVQDNLGKVKKVSFQHLQLLDPTEHLLTNLLDINSFGRITKYINHPNLMADLSTTIKAKFDMHLKCTHQNEMQHNSTLKIFWKVIWSINTHV